MTGAEPLVSVIVPTYHRPRRLAGAVESVLAQDVVGGGLEVVVCVSDAGSAEDRIAAERLATADPRVVVTVAGRLGPAAARNAGMAIARGRLFAFIDDDCTARPGWLRAGLARLAEVDLVQGRTLPAEPVEGRRFAYSIRVERLSRLWETCNLMVRRAAAERAGGFEEDWNPLGRPGLHWGEDTRWGWRVVRAGASYAFEPDAVVEHAVHERSLAELIEYRLRARFLPMFVRDFPEMRPMLYRGWFIDRGQARIAASAVLLTAAGVARAGRAPRAARALAALGAAPLLTPLRGHAVRTLEEGLMFGAALYGSVKYRRLLL